MQIAKYITKRTIVCPTCGGDRGSSADHLIQPNKPQTFGSWSCNSCGVGYRGTIDAEGQVGVEAVPEDKRHDVMTLVVLPPQTEPVYLLLNLNEWTNKREPELKLDKEYYINEHSCPTNWLNNIETIQIGDDADPHGLLRHVRTISKEEYNKNKAAVRLDFGYKPENTTSSDNATDRFVLERSFPEVAKRFVPDNHD